MSNTNNFSIRFKHLEKDSFERLPSDPKLLYPYDNSEETWLTTEESIKIETENFYNQVYKK